MPGNPPGRQSPCAKEAPTPGHARVLSLLSIWPRERTRRSSRVRGWMSAARPRRGEEAAAVSEAAVRQEHYPLQDSNLRPARLEGGQSIG